MIAEATLEAQRQVVWARFELRLLELETRTCVVCGGPDGPECAGCTADWDKTVDRAGDL